MDFCLLSVQEIFSAYHKKTEKTAIQFLGNVNDFLRERKKQNAGLGEGSLKYAERTKLQTSERCIGEAVYHLVVGPESSSAEFATLQECRDHHPRIPDQWCVSFLLCSLLVTGAQG